MAPLIGNEPQHEEIYWSEDEDETAEDTCSNRGENMVGKYIKENGVTDELFENKDTRPYEEGKGKAYAPPKDTPPDPNDGTTQGPLLSKEIKRNLRLRKPNDILETGSHILYEEHIDIASEIHNGTAELNPSQAEDTPENNSHTEYADMASKFQSEENELKVGQADDALEHGNHDEYIDVASKLQSEDFELKVGRADDALENGNHDEHIDMASKSQS